MDQEAILYLSVTALVALIIITDISAYGPLGLVVLVLGLLSIAMLLMINFADFIVFPVFTRLLRITMVPARSYTIPPTQNAIVKYTSGLFYASGYLTANIYNYVFNAEGITEGEEGAMTAGPSNWEKATANINFPFKFNIVSSAEEVQRYREDLEAKRGMLEFQYSKETQTTTPNQMTMEDFQRRMRVVQTKIDRLGQGEKPVTTMMYIESTAVGISEKEAVDALTSQLQELQTVFSVFDLSITRIVGREMYYLYTMNYFIPDLNELKSNFQFQT